MQIQGSAVAEAEADELAGDDGADDEDEEEEEHGKVQDGVAHDATLAELRLLEGVDWWADLTAAGFY